MAQRARLTTVQPSGVSVNRTLRQPLYDTEIYPAAGINALRFFVNPQGTPLGAARKTLFDTNLLISGALSTPNRFWLAGFRVEIEPGAMYGNCVASHLAIIHQGLFQWFFGSNAWLQIPLAQIPQGVALDGFGGAVAYTRQGVASPQMYDFRVGQGDYQCINPTESFHAEISFPNGADAAYADTRIRVYALGFLDTQL